MQLALFTDMPKRTPKIADVGYSDDFLRFWQVFPPKRRKDKPGAWRAFQRAVKVIMRERFCDAHTAGQFLSKRAADYAESDEGMCEYVRGPEPWLNQHAWEDEPEVWERREHAPKRRDLPPDLPARDA